MQLLSLARAPFAALALTALAAADTIDVQAEQPTVEAAIAGGALWLQNSAATGSDCVFTNNATGNGLKNPAGHGVSAGHGGAIALRGATCALERCTFDGNSAGDGGEAVGELHLANGLDLLLGEQ